MGSFYLGSLGRRPTPSVGMTVVLQGTFGCLVRNLDLLFTAMVLNRAGGVKNPKRKEVQVFFSNKKNHHLRYRGGVG